MYTQEALKKLTDQIQDKAQAGTLLVYKEPPIGEPPNLLDAVGQITEGKFDGSEITLEVQDVADSNLAKLVRTGRFEINPVSFGTVDTLEDGTQVVKDAEISHFSTDPSPPAKPDSD